MSTSMTNKYRAAVNLLLKGRDGLVENLADEIVAGGTDLIEGGYLFHEFLEIQGTRLHFLSLLVSQLEFVADSVEEEIVKATILAPHDKAVRKKPTKPRRKKVSTDLSTEEFSEES